MSENYSSMTGTYDPADNKLRLRALSRLPRELYDRVRAAGFIWAPKQDLFVAPSWSPGREDLLLELCGEVGDEDTSLVERAEQRAERFSDYSDSRAADAEQAHKAVASICDGIPLGQPILVGHHSEKHARKDAERIENGMRRAVKMWETSEYWQQRAAGAVHAAKYKERPDVRARRIKGIEKDKRGTEKQKAQAQQALKFWNGGLTLRNHETGATRPFEIIEENRKRIADFLGSSYGYGVNFARPESEGGGWWSSWDVLRPDEERYAACPSKTVAECQATALRVYPAQIAGLDRWLAHYENRLAYERAMLAADGGTEADKNKPEKGGGCRCWASPRGGWSYIQKVNKVSVTVLDNWGNGGGNFTRTIPFDKLAAVMSAAAVQEARDCGTLVESTGKIGFGLRGSGMDAAAVHAQPDAPAMTTQERAAHYIAMDVKRAAAGADSINADTGELHFNAPKEPTPGEKFDALKEQLKVGVQIVTARQLFPTPPELAKRMVELADIQLGNRVLEPSAGTGRLIEAMGGQWTVTGSKDEPGGLVAVEINLNLAHALAREFPLTDVRRTDFLTCNGDLGKFDRIVMNPPFEHGSDIEHIRHAIGFLNPGGRLVAICANGSRQREALEPLCDEWHDLEPGTFKESGTMVNTALILITN